MLASLSLRATMYIQFILTTHTQPACGNRWLLELIVILRLGFIPLFLLCNAQPRGSLPVVFTEDWQYVIFIVLMGLSNGYLGTLCFIYAPQVCVELLHSNSFLVTPSSLRWYQLNT